jgi:hypothetical protein
MRPHGSARAVDVDVNGDGDVDGAPWPSPFSSTTDVGAGT